MEIGTAELQGQDDHQSAVDNQGVVMGELDPVTSERRPSSDTSGTVPAALRLSLPTVIMANARGFYLTMRNILWNCLSILRN